MRVGLVAAGMTTFGNHPDSPKQLFDKSFDAMRSHAPDWHGRVDEAWIGTVGFGGHQPGNSAALFLEGTPSEGAPAHRVENACASSGFAIRNAALAIQSGAIHEALVAGVESMNPFSPAHKAYWLGVSGDTEVERMNGLTFPGVYGMMARAHMHEHGTTPEHLAAVAVKNHRHGAHNPHAQFQKEITMEKALGSALIADPLRLFDCCSTTDGAASLLLVSEERAKEFPHVVWLTGSGAATDTLALHDRKSLTHMQAAKVASQRALHQAAKRTTDMDFVEVHDCFTIAELVALESMGFYDAGQAGPATLDGRTTHGGDVVVNPSGGLKAKGHPLGASGAGQVVEVFEQFTGFAGKRAVPGATTALTHNVGGSGATCAVHVWEAP